MRESEIQRKMLLYLKGVPNLYVVNFVGSAVTAKGTPDILCCYKGKFIAFEVKREDSSYGTTATQKARLQRIKRAGGQGFVVKSLQDVVNIIERLSDEYS